MESTSNIAPVKSQQGIQTTFFIIIILILLAIVGYLLYSSKKTMEVLPTTKTDTSLATTTVASSTQSSSAETESAYRYINLSSAKGPLTYTFEIPADYVAYIEEGYEGGYAARIKVLKETSPGIFKNSEVGFWITAESPLNVSEKGGIAAVDTKYKNSGASAVYTTLGGNKAVTAQNEIGGGVTTTGYVNNSKSSKYPYIIDAYYIPESADKTLIEKTEYERILKTFKAIESRI